MQIKTEKSPRRAIFVAGKPLVHVPKLRSGSKYSGQLRFPHAETISLVTRRTRGHILSTGRRSSSSCRSPGRVVRGSRSGRDGAQTAEIDTGTVFRLRCSLAVGCEDHLLVGCVRGLLVDFGQCTADGFDCVSIFYFCHRYSAFAEQTARWAVRPLHCKTVRGAHCKTGFACKTAARNPTP